MKSPFISIVVPTYNSTENLRRFLYSFLTSTYKNFEILVNDNLRTTDNTLDVITETKARGLDVVCLRENKMMV